MFAINLSVKISAGKVLAAGQAENQMILVTSSFLSGFLVFFSRCVCSKNILPVDADPLQCTINL